MQCSQIFKADVKYQARDTKTGVMSFQGPFSKYPIGFGQILGKERLPSLAA